MGDRLRTIISASYSKNLKKFASTTKEVESRKVKIMKYLNSSIVDLRQKAVDLADSKYSLFSDNKDAVEKYENKVKNFFTQIMLAKKLVNENRKVGILDNETASKYMNTLDELESRTLRLFEIDAIRDRADTDFNKYSMYLKYRFGNVDSTIKRLEEQLAKEKDPHRRKEIDAKIKEIKAYSEKAKQELDKYSDGFINNYAKNVMMAKQSVDKLYDKAKQDANVLYKQMASKRSASKSSFLSSLINSLE